ncbi:nitroreductase family protein [Herbaspirillum rubrisubalbicans]|uniref:Nitroreductase n=1 Tax=Herbaspirillum rubrisubalbicans TaxID=80842 RepID=A0AAD0XFS0_9BURK|nr:nitroreductase family protein [Herbaspirillum rubrisubalbicans]AYR24501.1 nitroreductase [Herbaspirillum rubrisubalbicans]
MNPSSPADAPSAASLVRHGVSLDEQLALIFDAALRLRGQDELRRWEFVFVRGSARQLLGRLLVDAARQRAPAAPESTLQAISSNVMQVPLVIALGTDARQQWQLSGAPEASDEAQMLALGAVALNLINSVHALGYGARWAVGAARTADGEHMVSAGLGFRGQVQLAGCLLVGTPGEVGIPGRRRARHPVDCKKASGKSRTAVLD